MLIKGVPHVDWSRMCPNMRTLMPIRCQVAVGMVMLWFTVTTRQSSNNTPFIDWDAPNTLETCVQQTERGTTAAASCDSVPRMSDFETQHHAAPRAVNGSPLTGAFSTRSLAELSVILVSPSRFFTRYRFLVFPAPLQASRCRG